MNKVTCCKDCEDRHLNCHSQCKKYQNQRGLLYKQPDDQPFREYWSARSNRCEHKKHIHKRR